MQVCKKECNSIQNEKARLQNLHYLERDSKINTIFGYKDKNNSYFKLKSKININVKQ